MAKEEVISFKADAALAARIRQLPNSSQFIRAAIQAALEDTCPLCRGEGVLSVKQREHWQAFLVTHHLETCPDCQEWQIVCEADEAETLKAPRVHKPS